MCQLQGGSGKSILKCLKQNISSKRNIYVHPLEKLKSEEYKNVSCKNITTNVACELDMVTGYKSDKGVLHSIFTHFQMDIFCRLSFCHKGLFTNYIDKIDKKLTWVVFIW